ncbi:endonuclease/exonuclease/phosphatase family protein [Cyclobacterium marinum]|uniref:endonuclease/exonuclease/phosphatase family protein n=1 Tax=Cyclobacterium marinum TaxID=104 RepID=UPI0011EC2C35|nr:endonuclease/exonuclease/phosphatase family protein [Cyclobacterium marinum]MBI0401558.1 endonuclease/exonuclease/phosphatase family protein [Cyclobacterium marinum]
MQKKVKTFLLIFIGFYLFSLQILMAQEHRLILKVLSYNIHYGIGMDSQKDLARIAEVINRLNPDIVGLQEVSDSSMVGTLAALTGMHGVFGASTEVEPPNLYHLLGVEVPESQLHYGDGILSRRPFKYLGNTSIPSASSSRYEAMAVDISLAEETGKETEIRFITTHFDYLETVGSIAARKASVGVIEETYVDGEKQIPTILTGDLNATPKSDVLDLLKQRGWVNTDFGKALYTVPSISPVKQIDYVLVRPENRWKIIDVNVIEEDLASDHLPLLMTLELLPADF